MLTFGSLAIFFLFHPAENLKVEVSKVRLVGTWRVVAIKNAAGKITAVEGPPDKFVITPTTISIPWGKEVIWAATYSVDASKTPNIVHQSVYRAPCLSGNTEGDEPFSFEGTRLILGGLVLERER
jgi:hypothetical protein